MTVCLKADGPFKFTKNMNALVNDCSLNAISGNTVVNGPSKGENKNVACEMLHVFEHKDQ